MCGISGLLSRREDGNQIVKKMNHRIKHRGPDAEGIWEGEGIVLGHRRLAILDLSDHGIQPMSYGDQRYWIVFNGEIYNFLEIREQLKNKSYTFQSDSDTEVILAAYAEWGTECLDKFNGMWAFAIWDQLKKELFLARDRFGIKPLYYHMDGNLFSFSSEMKGLFPVLGEVVPNTRLVEQAMSNVFSYESSSECLIKGIHRFPAGSYGIYKNGALHLSKWWNTLHHIPEIPVDYREQVEYFQELFLDACKLRMRSDVPIGTCLSGGLDSSAVVCAMKHLAGMDNQIRSANDWQHAFVATFPGSLIDERMFAEQVLDFTDIRGVMLNINPLEAIDRLDEMLYMQEDLYLTSPIPFMLTYESVRHNGVVVTLDGHGADELFGGYPSSIISATQDSGFNLQRNIDLFNIYKNINNRGLLDTGKTFLTGLARKRAKKMMPFLAKNTSGKIESLSSLNNVLYQETHETILPTLLRNYDRYSMRNGVEIRMPFMDWRIVTFAFALPDTAKIGNGFTKRIIRDAMAPYMPPEIAYRKTKIGFNSPIVDWLKGPLKPWLFDTIRSREFNESGLVNAKSINEAAERVIHSPNMTWQEGEKLWTDMMPFLWQRAVVKGEGKYA